MSKAYRVFFIKVVGLFFCFSLSAMFCNAGEIQGQKQMIVIDDVFQFIPGTWATYTIHDKQKQEEYEMTFSVMEDENRDEGPCSWMEVMVKAKNIPAVVTRFLVKKTTQGPGKVLEAIVEMGGFSPFTVPQNFMEGEDAEVGQTQNYHLSKKIREKVIKFQDREIKLWLVEAVSDNQHPAEVWISEELPPMGIFKINTPEIGMYLVDWGNDAKSRITGTPINFYLWIASQIGESLINTKEK